MYERLQEGLLHGVMGIWAFVRLYDWDDEARKISISVLLVLDDRYIEYSHMAMTTNLRDIYSSDCYCRTLSNSVNERQYVCVERYQ